MNDSNNTIKILVDRDELFIQIIDFWHDRIIQSAGLPPRLITVSTEYGYASERIKHWRSQINNIWDSSHVIGCDFVRERVERQVEQTRNYDIKLHCKYYNDNPYLKCAVDPMLNCNCCLHYES